VNTIPENTLFSLLVNDDFINYVLNPTLVLDEMWDEFFASHPEMIAVADEAKSVLLGETIQNRMSTNEMQDLENRILAQCGLSVA
jgi:hypothetical protein